MVKDDIRTELVPRDPAGVVDSGDGGMHAPRARGRIEARRMGVFRRGTIHYADDLQILVKWDDGSSSSLRIGRDEFQLVERDQG